MVSIAQIREAIKNSGAAINAETMPIDVAFAELGLDSLDRFNIFLEIEVILGKEIPDEDIEKIQTVRSLVQYINGAQ